jgi:2,4-dienoyl-CoA reductase-like NADH-dependent reductase (Old Yellow Enzyme family)
VAGTVEAFAAAAGRAARAGFRYVELHAAHGFLIHEFLSPIANARTDGYGGALENRARFFLEVVRAVREAVGPGVALGARLSATEWIPGGWDLEDTVVVARWAAEAGVDHFDISTGGLDNPTIPVGPGYQVRFAAAVREALAGTGATVNALGMILGAAQAEEIVATGQADAVMVGRPLMRNPHLFTEWAAELGVDLHGVLAPPYLAAGWGT